MSYTLPALGIQRVKVIALAVRSLERANRFYEDMLGLARAFEGAEHVGWQLDEIVLMLKPDWETPTATPNPRITLASVDAMATQAALRARDRGRRRGAGLRRLPDRQLPRQRRQQALVLFPGKWMTAAAHSSAEPGKL